EELAAFNAEARRDATEALIGLYFDHPELLTPADTHAVPMILVENNIWGFGNRLDAARGQADKTIHSRVADELHQHPGSPLIAYFVGNERSFAWIVTDRETTVRQLPNRRELQRLLTPVLVDMNRPGQVVNTDDARVLGDILWQPLAGHWQPDRLLRIIPDNLLTQVPWGALPAPGQDTGRLAVEHGSLLQVHSLAALAQCLAAESGRRPDPENLRMLALGVDSALGGSGQSNQVDLRHAESEAQQIGELWPARRAVVKVGSDASWQQITGLRLSQFGVVHLATRATVHQGRPKETTIRLGDAAEFSVLTIPMVRSLDLDAELVYLSCCRAAGGASGPSGGVMDFAGAFLDAGARTVIASTNLVD
ncbi:MAG: CHAT domain-containing protein, partial [bacterium]|nr:CHAT domain-containing protein [bacterium]